MVHSPDFFCRKVSNLFLLRVVFLNIFCMVLVELLEMMVGDMCNLLLYDTGICHPAFIEHFFILCLSIPFFFLFFNLESINLMKLLMIQHVLALCALLTGVILKGLFFKNLCLMCVHVCFVLCLWSDWFCGLTWQKVYISENSFEMCICLWPEFDCPEGTLCGWQDIKIQLLTNCCLTFRNNVPYIMVLVI